MHDAKYFTSIHVLISVGASASASSSASASASASGHHGPLKQVTNFKKKHRKD